MTDLHTHILPGMDDGAADVEMSLAMLRMERDQGVDTVVLSSHFYPLRESAESFLLRREGSTEKLMEAISRLDREEQASLPRLIPAAEVAWVPNLAYMDELPKLCIGSSSNFLLELPFTPWDKKLAGQIYELMGRTGLSPVLAHPERYLMNQKKSGVAEILALGLPAQLSADALLGGVMQRGKSLKALGSWAHFIASDCHDVSSRRPRLGEAMEVVVRKLGVDAAEAMDAAAADMLQG